MAQQHIDSEVTVADESKKSSSGIKQDAQDSQRSDQLLEKHSTTTTTAGSTASTEPPPKGFDLEAQLQKMADAWAACAPGYIPLQEYFSQKMDLWPRAGKQVVGCCCVLQNTVAPAAASTTSSGGGSEAGKDVAGKKRTILVYQAYRPEIAIAAAKHQNFNTENPHYLPDRMTWIKPNFLWMMYRCGWASKHNQERVLMIEVHMDWFLGTLLPKAKLANSQGRKGGSGNNRSTTVVQWDPDHTPNYGNQNRRAIQIGMRGAQLEEWIQGTKGPAIAAIHDITDFVVAARPVAQGKHNFSMPKEEILTEAVFPHLCCPSTISEEEYAPGYVPPPEKPSRQQKKNAEKKSTDTSVDTSAIVGEEAEVKTNTEADTERKVEL